MKKTWLSKSKESKTEDRHIVKQKLVNQRPWWRGHRWRQKLFILGRAIERQDQEFPVEDARVRDISQVDQCEKVYSGNAFLPPVVSIQMERSDILSLSVPPKPFFWRRNALIQLEHVGKEHWAHLLQPLLLSRQACSCVFPRVPS